MKKTVFAVFIAFWASVGTMLALHAMSGDSRTEGEPVVSDDGYYSLAQVARHNSPESCWMAIEGKVYDFTDYIPEHPTPPEVMHAWCGREATEGMRTKGYGRDHSRRAWAMMEDYLIGELRQE